MFKFVVLCAVVAVARAGYLGSAAPALSYSTYAAAPAVSYAAPAVSYAAPAVGYSAAPAVSYSHTVHAAPAIGYAAPAIHAAPLAATTIVGQQSNILRSFGNLGTVSTYSKTLDTPFSSVSKSDVRVSNPGLRLAAPVAAYATHAVAASPVVHTSYHGNAFGVAAAPASIGYGAGYGYGSGYGYGGYAAAAPLAIGAGYRSYSGVAPLAHGRVAYGGLGYAGGYGVGYSAAPAVAHVSYTGNYGSYGW